MSEALSAENSAGTTDEQTTDTRVLDLDAAKPAAIDGATAIFVPAYERVSGALRYDGDVVTHLIGVYSKGDARNALADSYSSAEITQAFERGAWMEANHIENANAAIACVESPEVATDGGTGRPDDCRCDEFDETVCPPCSMAGFDTRADVESMTTVRSERANMGGGESTGVEEL